jgi:hypothetical protein
MAPTEVIIRVIELGVMLCVFMALVLVIAENATK